MNPVAERYLYIPLAGYAFAISACLKYILEQTRIRRAKLSIAFIALLLFVAVPLVSRQLSLYRWRDELALWRTSVRVAPESARAHFNLGRALKRSGATGKALDELLEANNLQPGVAVVNFNLGLIMQEQSKLREAENYYKETTEIDPNAFRAHYKLGLLLAKRGRYEEALGAFEKALEIRPDAMNAILNYRKTLGLFRQTLPKQAPVR